MDSAFPHETGDPAILLRLNGYPSRPLLHLAHASCVPNVDFYVSFGLIYEAPLLAVEMFPVLFAIGRTSGWTRQWAWS